MSIRLSNGSEIPIEMHKIRVVQAVHLAPARKRLVAMEEAGYNTFLLRTRDIFLDMLTDSGTNAMSDVQQSSMLMPVRRAFTSWRTRSRRFWATSICFRLTRAAPPSTCWPRLLSSPARSSR
jgi:tryptophanase